MYRQQKTYHLEGPEHHAAESLFLGILHLVLQRSSVVEGQDFGASGSVSVGSLGYIVPVGLPARRVASDALGSNGAPGVLTRVGSFCVRARIGRFFVRAIALDLASLADGDIETAGCSDRFKRFADTAVKWNA